MVNDGGSYSEHEEDSDSDSEHEDTAVARRQSRVVKRVLRSALPLANVSYPVVHVSEIEYPLGMALKKAIESKSGGSWEGGHAAAVAADAAAATADSPLEGGTLRSSIVHLLDAGACPNRPNLEEVTPFAMAVEL